MTGRPRLPTRLKALRGTLQPCRTNPDEPTPSPHRPVAPGWLPTDAKQRFDELVDHLDRLGLASASDVDMISLTAMRLDELEACQREVRDGAPFAGGRRNPAQLQANEAARHAHGLLAQLGMSPAARAKLCGNFTAT